MDDYVPTFDVPRRAVWPWILGIVVALLAGGYFAWRAWTKPKPLRVLVAIDLDGYWWDGSRPGEKIANELGDFLADMGFQPVRADEAEAKRVLNEAASPLEAAKDLRVAFVVTASLTPKLVPLPIDGTYYEMQVVSTLNVQHVEDDQPFFSTPIETHSGALTKERGMEVLEKNVSRVLIDIVVPALFDHASIKELLHGRDPVLVDQLSPGKKWVEARNAEMTRVNDLYEQLAKERDDEEKGVAGLTFHSDMSANDMLVAVGPKGVLRVTAPVLPFFHPTTHELMRRELLETVEWAADGEPTVLWRGHNVFTYPSVTPGGSPVVLVEDLYGVARGLVVIDDSGVRRLDILADLALSEPRVSPDGKAVAVVDRTCRDCARRIAVIDIATSKEMLRISDEDYPVLGEFKWLDNDRLLVVCQPAAPPASNEEEEEPEPPALGVWLVPVKGERTLIMEAPERSLIDPVGSPDGKHIAVSDYDRQIFIVDLATQENRAIDVGGRASALSYSADGGRIVFEVVGGKRSAYHEIGIVDVADGKVRMLTANDSPDRLPVFSPDGKRVYFEARNADPVFEDARAVSRVASLPIP